MPLSRRRKPLTMRKLISNCNKNEDVNVAYSSDYAQSIGEYLLWIFETLWIYLHYAHVKLIKMERIMP
jgi:hypothetical protein